MKKRLGLLLSFLALTACDPEKIPITGKRVSVVSYESALKPDEEAKGTPVILPLSEMGRDWPQTGGGPDHVMPHFSVGETLAPAWTTSIGQGNGRGRLLSCPVVAEGMVYTLDTYGTVTAVHAASGEILWEVSVANHDAPFIGGGLAYGNGKLFVTSPHAEVLGLEAKTGQVLWTHKTPSPARAAPTLAEGRLFVLTISNQLEVLDAEKGTLLWNHAGITEYAGLLGTASPAVSNGVVLVTYSSGEIYALKAENGHILWTETLTTTRRPDSLSSLSHIKALPVIHQHIVVVVGHNQKMAAYDLRRGEKLWERRIGGTRTPAVVGDFIFMVNTHHELVCLTLKHGQVVWVQKLPASPEAPVSWEGPLVARGKLYLVNSGGQLVSFNPETGAILNVQSLGAPCGLPPLAAQETVYLLTQQGDLIALR